MRREVILVTGANGEMGHELIPQIASRCDVIGLDIQPVDEKTASHCYKFIQGDVLDEMLLGRLVAEYEIRSIFHLASILSTKAEYNPIAAHRVNVEGTLNLLRLAVEQTQWQGKSVRFIYPSSIAVYGMPNLKIKMDSEALTEDMFLMPTTMYGCNKLYCEHLGRYFEGYYKQLAAENISNTIDFRCIRFPGLISGTSIPTGGTSDYAPEIFHSAATNTPYKCFVRPDTVLPFMVMPDAIKSLITIESVPKSSLSKTTYNVTSFSMKAKEFHDIALQSFPHAQIIYEPSSKRQAIVDSWPAYLDDSSARSDWRWTPDYHEENAFSEYLLPQITNHYKT